MNLKNEDLQKTFPINVFNYEMTTEFFLVHLTTHLNYHLGQINYHRRLLDNYLEIKLIFNYLSDFVN